MTELPTQDENEVNNEAKVGDTNNEQNSEENDEDEGKEETLTVGEEALAPTAADGKAESTEKMGELEEQSPSASQKRARGRRRKFKTTAERMEATSCS